MKSNYGPKGEAVRVRWQRGVFVPAGAASSIDQAAAHQPVDDAFMRCLDAATASGRDVSDKVGRNYAPTIFEEMPEAGDFKKVDFAKAMPRLFSRRGIRVETVGSASRQKSKIIRATPED
jgi:hypothetical protein